MRRAVQPLLARQVGDQIGPRVRREVERGDPARIAGDQPVLGVEERLEPDGDPARPLADRERRLLVAAVEQVVEDVVDLGMVLAARGFDAETERERGLLVRDDLRQIGLPKRDELRLLASRLILLRASRARAA